MARENWVLPYLPYAEKFFTAHEEGVLDGLNIIEFVGPAGCLRREIAEEYAKLLELTPMFLSGAELRIRPDKVYNRLQTPSVSGKRRLVILHVRGSYVIKELMIELVQYIEHNKFVLITDTPLNLGELTVRMGALSLEGVKLLLKRASKKTAWKFDHGLVAPVTRLTGGIPRRVIGFIQMSFHKTTPGAALKTLEDSAEVRAAKNLYTEITAGRSAGELGAAINAALEKCGWSMLADRISDMLVEDMLKPDALPDGALDKGAWELLRDFSPNNKQSFVAGCFAIHAGVKRYIPR